MGSLKKQLNPAWSAHGEFSKKRFSISSIMKDRIDNETLLCDLFDGGEQFREETLSGLLSQARRKARHQRIRRHGLVLVTTLAVFGIAWLGLWRDSEPATPNQVLISIQPPAEQPRPYVVRSAPANPDQVVRTGETGVETVRSGPARLIRVRTDAASAPAHRMDDAELLALFPDHIVALVRYEGARTELILVQEK